MKYKNNINKTIKNRLAPFYSNQYIVSTASSAYFHASQRLSPSHTVKYKKARLSLTNTRDAKPCQKCCSSTVKQVTTDNLTNNLFEVMEIRCLVIKFLIRIRSAVRTYSFSCYCLRNTRNVAKFQENLTLQQFKVIQGHRSWCQWKAHIVTLAISGTVFEIFRLKDRKLLILPTHPLFDVPVRG